MTTRAIIQARMGGVRFPGKVLYDLCGKPVLKHVIDRVYAADTFGDLEDLIVATAGPQADTIQGHCEEWGVACFVDKRDENDVLGRFVQASADLNNRDWIVRVCADNPLVEPAGIDQLVEVARQSRTRFDYVGYWTRADGWLIRQPTGQLAEAVRVGALRLADNTAHPSEPGREHVTSGVYGRPGLFTSRRVDPPGWLHDGRPLHLAIDTPDDLRRVADYLENGVTA